MRKRSVLPFLSMLGLTAVLPNLVLSQTTLTGGLQAPMKISLTAAGDLVVAEGGIGRNNGRVSLVRRSGQRLTLISGLPAGPGAEGGNSGPTAAIFSGDTLYVLIGQGNGLMAGPTPGKEVTVRIQA